MDAKSREQVAYDLLHLVAMAEKRNLGGSNHAGGTPASGEWILDMYAECLDTVIGERPSRGKLTSPTIGGRLAVS